jgi:hypothetical protein
MFILGSDIGLHASGLNMPDSLCVHDTSPCVKSSKLWTLYQLSLHHSCCCLEGWPKFIFHRTRNTKPPFTWDCYVGNTVSALMSLRGRENLSLMEATLSRRSRKGNFCSVTLNSYYSPIVLFRIFSSFSSPNDIFIKQMVMGFIVSIWHWKPRGRVEQWCCLWRTIPTTSKPLSEILNSTLSVLCQLIMSKHAASVKVDLYISGNIIKYLHLLVSCFLYFSALKTEATYSSETYGSLRTTKLYNQKNAMSVLIPLFTNSWSPSVAEGYSQHFICLVRGLSSDAVNNSG